MQFIHICLCTCKNIVQYFAWTLRNHLFCGCISDKFTAFWYLFFTNCFTIRVYIYSYIEIVIFSFSICICVTYTVTFIWNILYNVFVSRKCIPRKTVLNCLVAYYRKIVICDDRTWQSKCRCKKRLRKPVKHVFKKITILFILYILEFRLFIYMIVFLYRDISTTITNKSCWTNFIQGFHKKNYWCTANALYRKFEKILFQKWNCVASFPISTDIWMQKLGTRPRSFISGNIFLNFRYSVYCLLLNKITLLNFLYMD